jgi:hypothetical protein
MVQFGCKRYRFLQLWLFLLVHQKVWGNGMFELAQGEQGVMGETGRSGCAAD